jgi:desulfoferrodoxin-like iron-binding protein
MNILDYEAARAQIRPRNPDPGDDKNPKLPRTMDIRFECHACGQSIEVNADGGGQAFCCPSCGAGLVVPTVMSASAPPVALPPKLPSPAPAPRPYVTYAPPTPVSTTVAWGVFKGLCGFFLLLIAGLIALIVFLSVLAAS